MFDSFRNSNPARDYKCSGRRLIEYGRGLKISSEIFETILLCDYYLRGTKQRRERIENDYLALEKFAKDDTNALDECEKELKSNKHSPGT